MTLYAVRDPIVLKRIRRMASKNVFVEDILITLYIFGGQTALDFLDGNYAASDIWALYVRCGKDVRVVKAYIRRELARRKTQKRAQQEREQQLVTKHGEAMGPSVRVYVFS